MRAWRQIAATGLLSAGLLTAVVAGFAAWRVWRALDVTKQLEDDLGTAAAEADAFHQARQQYDRMAVELPRQVEELNRLLLSYTMAAPPRDTQPIQRRVRELSDWVQSQKSTVISSKTLTHFLTINPGELVVKIEKSYADYSGMTEHLLVAGQAVDEGSLLPRWAEASTASQALLALAGEARAKADAIELFLAGPKNWSPNLRLVMKWLPQLTRALFLAALLTVLTLGGFLAISLYRMMVAPLRAKMLQSNAIIERQGKLAHLGELAAGLAHEIRNPLTAINARLFALQPSLPAGSEEANDARIIRDEIRRLDRIVRDFLVFARPSTPNRIPISAAQLLREIQEFLAPSLKEQAINLEVDGAVDALVLADLHQIKQVLINLIQNAADCTGRGGTIRLRAHSAPHQLNGRQTDAVILEVEDHGPGIPPEIQEKLFDPFFSTKEGGTGLGLAIAERILVQHGGDIDFKTSPGAGTTFQVVLPAATTSVKSHGADPDR